MLKNLHWFSCTVPVILVRFNFLGRFSKYTQISNFTKIRPVGAELFDVEGQTDGQTDMTKLIVVFLNFAKEPKSTCSIEVGCFHFAFWNN
jgi:hypothetical protein